MPTTISYAIAYDDEAWVEANDRVAARVWITTSRPDEEPTRIEVVLIATLPGRPNPPHLGNHLAELAQRRRAGRLLRFIPTGAG